MSTPQQPQQPQNQQQSKQTASEAVVLDISTNEAVGPQQSHKQSNRDQELLAAIAALQAQLGTGNKAMQDLANQVMENRSNTLDLRDKPTREFVAGIAESNGNFLLASALRGESKMDESFSAGFSRQMKRNITVGHLAYTVGGVTILVIGYEAIASKYDLPRLGLFDPADQMKLPVSKPVAR